ncbi:hypothetical protein AYB33_12140 [Leptospira santarosai]|nr:hypothetical protein AYB33_12140 [Leptospira santarosai]
MVPYSVEMSRGRGGLEGDFVSAVLVEGAKIFVVLKFRSIRIFILVFLLCASGESKVRLWFRLGFH